MKGALWVWKFIRSGEWMKGIPSTHVVHAVCTVLDTKVVLMLRTLLAMSHAAGKLPPVQQGQGCRAQGDGLRPVALLQGGRAARRDCGFAVLRGPGGAAAQVWQGGGHLVVRRHPLHPAVRLAALPRRLHAADLQAHHVSAARHEERAVAADIRRSKGLRTPYADTRPA
eukprot:304094-Chlamydomonas_euryale.AAC.4